MRNINFIDNKIYHIYNRGVDKRNIFLEEEDYLRAIHNLFEFNDTNPAKNIYYKTFIIRKPESYEAQLRKIQAGSGHRKLLVKILAFCLMPNHFHLLLQQAREEGITQFMHKFGTGYTNFFNKKYKRSGSLFQGRFKAVSLERNEHLLHLPFYIHLNPLDINFIEWRERKLFDFKKATNFIKTYRWSSYMDYVGIKNFPSVTQRDFLENFYQGMDFEEEMMSWLKSFDLGNLEKMALE